MSNIYFSSSPRHNRHARLQRHWGHRAGRLQPCLHPRHAAEPRAPTEPQRRPRRRGQALPQRHPPPRQSHREAIRGRKLQPDKGILWFGISFAIWILLYINIILNLYFQACVSPDYHYVILIVIIATRTLHCVNYTSSFCSDAVVFCRLSCWFKAKFKSKQLSHWIRGLAGLLIARSSP